MPCIPRLHLKGYSRHSPIIHMVSSPMAGCCLFRASWVSFRTAPFPKALLTRRVPVSTMSTRILYGAGLQKRHVARINAFVTHRDYLQDYMRARDRWVDELDSPPASTLVIVQGFARPEFKVEVEVTACA